MVETGMCAAFTLLFLVWYLKIRLSSIRVTGISKRSSYYYKGYISLFEYEIEGIHLCNYEKKQHLDKCKEGKEYLLYVRKNNYNYIISGKFMSNLILWMIAFGTCTISRCIFIFIYGVSV